MSFVLGLGDFATLKDWRRHDAERLLQRRLVLAARQSKSLVDSTEKHAQRLCIFGQSTAARRR